MLLDLHLPGIDGSAGVAHVCEAGYRALVVSAAGTPEDVIDAIAAGAVGYLTKETDADEITREPSGRWPVPAIPTSPRPWRRTCSGAEKSASDYQLTKRERDVLALLAAGEHDQDIAAQLFIATTTVHSHLERIHDGNVPLSKPAHHLGPSPRDRPERARQAPLTSPSS